MKYFVVLNEIKSLLKAYKATGNEKCLSAIILTHATDAIEELQSQLPKWIPVSERLPKERQKVLFSYRGCITKQPRIFIGWYNGKQWDSLYATEYDVTHWMPLPEPPKEETDGN